jgi:hypothetical protein
MMALRGAAVGAAILATILLTGPFHYGDLHLPFPDTAAHAMLFYGLTVLAFAALPRSRAGDIALAAIGVAIASEMTQALVGREMSLHDVLGDATGVAAAYGPVLVTRLRELARTHPDVSFAELRRMDRRHARPAAAVLVLERLADA